MKYQVPASLMLGMGVIINKAKQTVLCTLRSHHLVGEPEELNRWIKISLVAFIVGR